MGLFEGKKGLILGVANDFSIAWAISKQLLEQGAELGFTHLPGEKMERRVRKLADPAGAKLVTSCDVQHDEDVARVFQEAGATYGKLDFVFHSIAFAPINDIKCPFVQASREGFKTAMDISVYSLAVVARHAAEVMPDGGSIADHDLLRRRAGGCGLQLDGRLQGRARYVRPLSRLRSRPEEDPGQRAFGRAGQDPRGVGRRRLRHARRLLRGGLADGTEHHARGGRLGGHVPVSDLASGISGEIMHVDCGYNAMGSPGRAIEAAKEGKAI